MYAISMLIFGNNLYLVGACLSAYVHKQYINENHLDIKLVAIVDNEIYKYKKELLKYFDKVIKINLLEIKLSSKYKVIYKYSKWMKYSINKWQVLALDEYEKILLIDIDILPINKDFYDIFNISTPGVLIRNKKTSFNQKLEIGDFSKVLSIDNKNLYKASLDLDYSIDAGLVLLKPSKKIYQEYLNFIKISEGDYGYISLFHSGVDETTLLLFFLYYKKVSLYTIPYEYAVIPWQDFDYDKTNIKGINFISMIKPWVKLPIIQWADENIWHVVAKKALPLSEKITNIYVDILLNELFKFSKEYTKLGKNSPYNLEAIKNKKMIELFHLLKQYEYENENQNMKTKSLSYDKIKKIMDYSKEIHSFMDKKLLIKMDKLYDIIG